MFQALSISAWLLCGAVASGWWFADFQRRYPSMRYDEFFDDRMDSNICYLFGPVALIVLGLTGSRRGWLWPWGAKAKREAGIE